ncbi:MAG: FliH/SctL family protein [Phycisphaerae bacterium]
MSTVIRAQEAGRILGRLSTVDLADHLAEARAVVEAAQRRAAQIIAEAEARMDRVLADAEESGYQAGYEHGYAEGKEQGHQAAHEESIKRFEQEHANIVAAMQNAVAEIDALKEDLMIAAQRDQLDFAVLVARKLTFAIGRLHPESAVENLRRALRLVESKTDLTIRVHPNDIASLDMFADSVLKQAEASRVVNVVADDSLAPGGCKVETERNRVDATLETQVDEIVSLLLSGKPSNA